VTAELDAMAQSLRRRIDGSLLASVKPRRAEAGMSQVFAMAPGYRDLYRYHLMLLRGLAITGDVFNISVKDLALLYEYWCFIKLNSLMNTERETYEGYWDDIAPFVKYGCVKDQKFYEMVRGAILLKKTDGKYDTLDEYKAANFDKTEKKIYYTNDEKRQAASVRLYTDRGIEVAVMSTLIDGNFMSFLEYQGKEEDRVKWENDWDTPFYCSDGRTPTMPCSSHPDFVPPEGPMQAYLEAIKVRE